MLLVTCVGRPGDALELELGSGADRQRVLIDVTEATSVLYNFDNRDSRPGQVASAVNDHWGLWYNRLNLQGTSGRLTLSLRADSAWFFASPTPASVADRLVRDGRLQSPAEREALFRVKASEAGIELSNRFINWVYPAKYSLSYGTPDLQVTVGDTYAQFGRGLVLSLRKLDELASDTTLRGLRVTAGSRWRSGRIQLTVLGGSLNPLRIDEASGRFLGVHSSVTPGFLSVTEAGMPRAIATEFVPEARDCARFGTCSYAPDRLAAAQVEVALGKLRLGTQASWLSRQAPLASDLVRAAGRVVTASQSFELPSIGQHGSLYTELALQQLANSAGDTESPRAGYAAYLAASWAEARYSLIAEGKHYRRFFPLSANVSPGRARELSLLQYSIPPTTEEVWNDTEFGAFNTCVSGGRVRAEAHVQARRSVYAWLGHYRSFAESAANDACEITPRNENRIWDSAVGLDMTTAANELRADVNLGTRFDSTPRSLAGPDGATQVFYRELFLRYTVSAALGGPFGLELQGTHRRRRQTVGGPEAAWLEGQHSTAVEWGERVSLAVGIEYDSRPDTPDTYWNLMLAGRPLEALNVGLFVGQRRGAQRCVGGVCRVYPPFEGVRLDATLRF